MNIGDVKFRGNDSYQTTFVETKFGNGLAYGTKYLFIKCPKATVYVSGALYKKGHGGAFDLKQVDMQLDDPDTKDIENVIRFELFDRKGAFEIGDYKLRIVADGRGMITDPFSIVDASDVVEEDPNPLLRFP